MLNQAGGRRQKMIGSGGGANNQIDVAGRQLGFFERLASSDGRHGRGRFTGAGNAAFANPGPRLNPVVVGVNELFEILIGQDLLGTIPTPSRDGGVVIHHIVSLGSIDRVWCRANTSGAKSFTEVYSLDLEAVKANHALLYPDGYPSAIKAARSDQFPWAPRIFAHRFPIYSLPSML
jgi:hypothetical protein